MKQITSSFTDEVDKVKESVSSSIPNLDINPISDAATSVNTIKEDIETITGPVKRQM